MEETFINLFRLPSLAKLGSAGGFIKFMKNMNSILL